MIFVEFRLNPIAHLTSEGITISTFKEAGLQYLFRVLVVFFII